MPRADEATPPSITGYRQLTVYEVDLINQVKELGNEIGRMVEGMQSNPALDQRWVAIAKTDLQTGFMALVRSVAQPVSF